MNVVGVVVDIAKVVINMVDAMIDVTEIESDAIVSVVVACLSTYTLLIIAAGNRLSVLSFSTSYTYKSLYPVIIFDIQPSAMLTSLLNLIDHVILFFRNNCISQPTAVVFIENLHTTHNEWYIT